MDQRKVKLLTELWIHMLTVSKSPTFCDINVIGSLYKTEVIVGGVPIIAFVDSVSQVCIV